MLADILNSIVNNSNEVYDDDKPYSFIRFLKFYDQSINVKYIINEYNEYIQQWCVAKNNQVDVNLYKQIIQQQYYALLKEISIDYSTAEEKRFLSNLIITEDILNNPTELNNLLDIILPFYIRKINTICEYYLNKRNDFKLRTTQLLDINTSKDAATTIKDLIIDELISNNANYSIGIDEIDNIKEVLAVDIEELYDNNDYFEKNSLSAYQTNDINYKSFYDYDNAIIDAIRQYPFYLYENKIFAFSVNPSLTTEDIDYLPIKDFIENAKTNNTNDVILSLQKSMVERYTGTDYYYLSTNSNSEVVSGLLVKADNAIFNILNNDILNTPTVEYNTFDDIRNIGVNFKPDKFGLLFYNTNNLKYEVNTSKLSPNSIYVYPDPNKYSKYSIPQLIWVVDNDQNKLNYTSQYAYGTPKTDPLLQYFYGYSSAEQQQDALDKDKIVFHGFENFINNGVITRNKIDQFGNEYVLFKDINYNKSNTYDINKNINKILNSNLDNFSYYTPLTIDNDVSSLFYYTLPMGNFSNNNFDYNTNKYRKFNICVDGYVIDTSPLGLSSYSTAESDWPNEKNISYDILVECGAISIVNNNSEGKYTISIPEFTNELYSHALTTIDFSSTNTFIASEQMPVLYDGGRFYTQDEYKDENIETINIINIDPSINKKDDSYSNNNVTTLTERAEKVGEFYVKNVTDGKIERYDSALKTIFDKYYQPSIPSLLYQELLEDKAIIDIDVIDDVLLVTTPNYIVYDKIIYENGKFIKSPYSPMYIDKRNGYIDKPSTYFYIESIGKIAYVQMINYSTEFSSLTGDFYAPSLKLIDKNNLSIETIKITNESFINENFDWSSINFIRRITIPKLIYNTMNNLYNLGIICYNYNDIPYLYNMSFINNIDYILLYSNTFYNVNMLTNKTYNINIVDVLYGNTFDILSSSTGNYIEIR